MTPGPPVRAVVVATPASPFLSETLEAIRAQQRPVDALDVVMVGVAADAPAEFLTASARTFGEAVDHVLASRPSSAEDEWLWLFHADSAPAPDALARLLAVASRRRRAQVVGAVQVGWNSAVVVNAGISVSRGGTRRISLAEQDDLDQGQHEGREDVLAVGLAGALVRRSLWTALGGTDPAYGKFGDSVDFCRRAWRAGADVVLAPRARVRHAQESLYGRRGPSHGKADARATHPIRRAAERYHSLAWGPAWRAPFGVAGSWLAAGGRAVFRLGARDPRTAAAELRVPLRLMPFLRHAGASRTRIAAAGPATRPPVEHRLLVGPLGVLEHIRTREWGAYERWRAANAPSDVQRAELRRAAVRRWWTLAALTALLAGVSTALFGTWVGPVLRGEMLTGAALGATDLTTAELWQRTWTGWSEAGLGAGALDGAWAALMLPLSVLPGGLATSVGIMLAFAPLFAGWAAWAAAGAVTRSTVSRVVAAVVWAALPAFLQSVSDGRLGAVIVHLLLPLFALALTRAAGVQARERLGDGVEYPPRRPGSSSAAAVAALVMAAASVAAPVLLIPLGAAAVAAAALVSGRRRALMAVPLPALVLHGPALMRVVTGEWTPAQALLRETGPALASTPASAMDLLWGVPQAPPAWPMLSEGASLALAYLPGVVLVIAGLVALGSGRAVRTVTLGWLVAGGGLAVAVISHHRLGAGWGHDGEPAANGWAGPGLSLAALGWGIAALGASRLPSWRDAARSQRAANALGAGLVMLVLAAHLTATIWPGRPFGGDVHRAPQEVLPLVAEIEIRSAPGTRVLVLWQDAEGRVRYSVVARDGASGLEGRPFPTTAVSVESLAPAVADMVAAGESSAEQLESWGVGVVVVSPEAETVLGGLTRSRGVTLIGASERGVSYRVGQVGDPVAPRAWIQSSDEAGDLEPLTSTRGAVRATVPAADDASRLVVLAVPADSRWSATLEGSPLPPHDREGRQAFELGAGGGLLEVSYYDAAYRWWWWAGAVIVVWTLLAALPLHDRRFREAVG